MHSRARSLLSLSPSVLCLSLYLLSLSLSLSLCCIVLWCIHASECRRGGVSELGGRLDEGTSPFIIVIHIQNWSHYNSIPHTWKLASKAHWRSLWLLVWEWKYAVCAIPLSVWEQRTVAKWISSWLHSRRLGSGMQEHIHSQTNSQPKKEAKRLKEKT